MGNPTGFIEFQRNLPPDRPPADRVKDWNDLHTHAETEAVREQGARCMDCGTPFCHTGEQDTVGCPLNNLIPEWNDLVYRDLWSDALNRLLKTNNFPEFTGKVCPAPCESACVLAIIEPAVTIKNIEWSIIERGWEEGWVKPRPPKNRTGKTVAVVGSGPAGLACADQLNRAGHKVTVFERADRIGGLLMYGIPNMKLEKHVVDRRVGVMEAEGVTFRTNVEIGVDISSAELERDHDAVVLCCGATKARDLPIEGRDLKGIHFAVDFLRANTAALIDNDLSGNSYISAKGRDVIVIGGGDTGTDCVGTSLRHGCRSLTQFEILPEPPARLPWPQFGRVSTPDYGQEEAAALFGADPRVYEIMTTRFVGDEHGHVAEAHTVGVEWQRGDGGRMTPVPIAGSERVWPTQLVLLSMGFLGPEDTVPEQMTLDRDGRSNVSADYGRFATNREGVFVAGDMRRGASLVVWAIMEGRGAAREVDCYLMGSTLLP